MCATGLVTGVIAARDCDGWRERALLVLVDPVEELLTGFGNVPQPHRLSDADPEVEAGLVLLVGEPAVADMVGESLLVEDEHAEGVDLSLVTHPADLAVNLLHPVVDGLRFRSAVTEPHEQAEERSRCPSRVGRT